jgi:hypothetical protein
MFFEDKEKNEDKKRENKIHILIRILDNTILYIEQTEYALMHYVITSSHITLTLVTIAVIISSRILAVEQKSMKRQIWKFVDRVIGT